MLFHEFWVIYTVKELDSHAKHGHKFQNDLDGVFLCQIHSLPGSYKFRKVFSIMALYDVMKGRIPCMGSSPRRACAHANQNERKSMAMNMHHSAALHTTSSKRMSPKKCAFGCKGKITLFSFPKNPALREQWLGLGIENRFHISKNRVFDKTHAFWFCLTIPAFTF